MWDFLKYFDIVRRLFALFANLRAVRARDPGTSAADLTKNITSLTTEGGTVKYIRCEINGTAYWFRACTAPA